MSPEPRQWIPIFLPDPLLQYKNPREIVEAAIDVQEESVKRQFGFLSPRPRRYGDFRYGYGRKNVTDALTDHIKTPRHAMSRKFGGASFLEARKRKEFLMCPKIAD